MLTAKWSESRMRMAYRNDYDRPIVLIAKGRDKKYDPPQSIYWLIIEELEDVD